MNTRIVVLALVMASAGPASAQWAVDASVGATVPVGQGEGRTTGLDLMGAVDWHPAPKLPIAFRAEVGWDRVGFAGFSQVAEYVTRIAFDVIVDPPLPGTRLRPYVLAGGGAYIFSIYGSNRVDPGLNIGAGLRYPIGPVQPFFEFRYHIDFLPSSYAFIPFQFGVRVPIP